MVRQGAGLNCHLCCVAASTSLGSALCVVSSCVCVVCMHACFVRGMHAAGVVVVVGCPGGWARVLLGGMSLAGGLVAHGASVSTCSNQNLLLPCSPGACWCFNQHESTGQLLPGVEEVGGCCACACLVGGPCWERPLVPQVYREDPKVSFWWPVVGRPSLCGQL